MEAVSALVGEAEVGATGDEAREAFAAFEEPVAPDPPDAAAVHPRAGCTWRSWTRRGVWIGNRVLEWQYVADFSNDPDAPGTPSAISLLSYSPRADRWHVVEEQDRGPYTVATPIWTAHEVIVPPASSWDSVPGYRRADGGARYDPRTNRWRRLPTSPMNDDPGPAVWTGRALVALNTSTSGAPGVLPGDTAAFDPKRDRWVRLARPATTVPLGFPQAVWTGRELLVSEVLVGMTQAGGQRELLTSGGLRLGP